jgi:hypothetical protein
MKNYLKAKSVTSFAVAIFVLAGASSTSAAVVFQSDFSGVSVTSGVDNINNTVSGITWDTTNGIDTPDTSMVFVGNGANDIDFFNRSDEIAVDYNFQDDGSWYTEVTSINLDASTSSISLTNLLVDLTVIDNSGSEVTNDNTVVATVEVFGSSSGSIGSNFLSQTDTGSGYITYDIDLSSLSALGSSETYTVRLLLEREGLGNASIDNLILNGNLTAVPEPSSFAFLAACLGSLTLLRRRRA